MGRYDGEDFDESYYQEKQIKSQQTELQKAIRQRDAARAVLKDREAELLELMGPCRSRACSLHFAHRGPCDANRKSVETNRPKHELVDIRNLKDKEEKEFKPNWPPFWGCSGCLWRFSYDVPRERAFAVWIMDTRHKELL